MTECIDLAEEEEPATVSEEYLARLAEYRRRLSLLRDNLFRLNSLIESEEALLNPGTHTRH